MVPVFTLQSDIRCTEADHERVWEGSSTNMSRMTNRLFLLSGYCFRLSYLWLLRRLRDLTTGVSDAAERPGSSVHFQIFFFTSVLNARVTHSSSNDRVVS